MYFKYSLPILAAILAYIFLNGAVVESGASTASLGMMNLGAGLITALVLRRQLNGRPDFWITGLGVLGIFGMIFGLRFSHSYLGDPASTMEVVYDLTVIGSVLVWKFVEGPLRLSKTPVHAFDVVLHVWMAVMVASRLVVHWQDDWSIGSFWWVLVAAAGYWTFNISIQLANQHAESPLATTTSMNVLSGLMIIGIGFVEGGVGATISLWSAVGAVALTVIVFSLRYAYQVYAPLGLRAFVIICVYDGLLVFAPVAMLIWFGTPFYWPDVPITAGFVLAMLVRIWFYRHLATKKS